MFLYYALAVIACIVAGVIIAVRSRKAEGVSYGVLDKVGIVTNILLIPAYIVVSVFCLFLVMLGMNPDGEGFMLVVSVLVSAITSTSSAIWGLGLGASVALRRKGKSKLSFWVQFAGVAGLAFFMLLYVLVADTLFASLN